MDNKELPDLQALFASAKPCRQPVHFSWRLVRRKKAPFLLLPEKTGRLADSFGLYSAHRPLAKLLRLLVPLIFRPWLAKFFGRIAIVADTESEFLQFLAQQSGLPAARLPSPAIKFGGVAGKTSRLVLLLCDAGGHPTRVVKVGLNPAGRAATEREAELLCQLPRDVIGCTGITGRFSSATVSAFATAYFPGASLNNDVGIEKLFQGWLSHGPLAPVRNLAVWRELQAAAEAVGHPQWPLLRDALAGQMVRPTFYHGDFAPWNVRMTNLESIQAFDWERGHLQGLPAWDWFHFIVQTSILVERNSPQRVAAELEQLVQAPRFQKYAQDAGISQIVEPLLLAYLLEQQLVVQPLAGAEATDRLFWLLWAKWPCPDQAGKAASVRLAELRLPAREQIQSAFAHLANLFWEPGLSPVVRPPLALQFARHWLVLLVSLVWIGGVAVLQSRTDPHLSFTPFYLVPGVLLALKADRRLGLIWAGLAGVAGPLMQYFKRPMIVPLDVTLWNLVMRVFVFVLMMILLDNVRKQSLGERSRRTFPEPGAIPSISGNWAVVLVTSIYFFLVVVLDMLTNPFYIFLPLYLLPCIVFTLSLNWRWGTLAAVIASVVGPLVQRFDDPGYQILAVECWNTLMRLAIFQTVVLLLDRIRRDNVLFSSIKPV